MGITTVYLVNIFVFVIICITYRIYSMWHLYTTFSDMNSDYYILLRILCWARHGDAPTAVILWFCEELITQQ